MIELPTKDNPCIAWWSGGVTSAVTCHLCIQWYGVENVRIIFLDTHNEDDGTYVFKSQCEVWYEKEIETLCSDKFFSVDDVWNHYLSLNVATGAICSDELKRQVRYKFEESNVFHSQAFGFTIEEIKRAKGMKMNNPQARPFFPLINELLTKQECIRIIQKNNNLFHQLDIPRSYTEGFQNNNCFKTGCVQGGIGYWKKMQIEYPEKFNSMADREHRLTISSGRPITILKDQSKQGGLVFLKKNPLYPNMKCIDDMKARPVESLMECNGFCGMDDIEPTKQ